MKTINELKKEIKELKKRGYTKENTDDCTLDKEAIIFIKLNTKLKTCQEFEKLIDKIERIDWDCNLPCGVVNGNTDKCKKCGKRKEESLDNSKLEELKQKLGEGNENLFLL